MFLWSYRHNIHWKSARSSKNNIPRLFDNGGRCSAAMLCLHVGPFYRWKIDHWVYHAAPKRIEVTLIKNSSFGNGLNTSTVPTWQSECSRSHRRGQLVMIEVCSHRQYSSSLLIWQGALITGGICFSYWLDFGFSFLSPNTIAWRFPIGKGIALS